MKLFQGSPSIPDVAEAAGQTAFSEILARVSEDEPIGLFPLYKTKFKLQVVLGGYIGFYIAKTCTIIKLYR